jgi:hypothetical protein
MGAGLSLRTAVNRNPFAANAGETTLRADLRNETPTVQYGKQQDRSQPT